MSAPDYAAQPRVLAPAADGAASVSQQLLSDGLRAAVQGINWCESDYAVSPSIAEWWNTISNVAFLVDTPLPLPISVALEQPRHRHNITVAPCNSSTFR